MKKSDAIELGLQVRFLLGHCLYQDNDLIKTNERLNVNSILERSLSAVPATKT